MTHCRTEELHTVTRMINAGDYEGALELARQLDEIEEAPGDIEWVSSRIAVAKGQFDEAEKLAVEGLKKSPGHYSLYFTLGNILAELGEPAAAKACLMGSNFEDYLNSRYFSAEAERLQLRDTAKALQPQILYSEGNKFFQDDVGMGDFVREEFKPPFIGAAKAGVCVVDDGKLWFDGHNLCVYDKNDQLVDACSIGNSCLIESIRAESSLKNLKGSLGVAVAPGTHNYFHWSTDLMPAFHLIDSARAEHGAVDQYLVSHQNKPFQLEFLKLAGVQPDHSFSAHIKTGCYFSAPRIVVPVFRHSTGMTMGQWAADYLRGLALQVVGKSADEAIAKSGKRVYVSRRDVAGRCVGNEAALIKELESRGFKDVVLDGMSVAEQMSLFSDCEMVVAPHGAGLANILYCPPGAVVLEFFGDFVNPCFRALARLGSLTYLQLSLDSPDTDSPGSIEQTRKKHAGKFQGFDLSPAHIGAILALVDENAPEAPALPVPRMLIKAIENRFRQISSRR